MGALPSAPIRSEKPLELAVAAGLGQPSRHWKNY
jgi:hypothetical protein